MNSTELNFFEQRTIEWNQANQSVVMIDQTLLPVKLVFVECKTVSEIIDSIKTMKIRGAPAIGVAGAMGVALSVLHSRAKTKAQLLEDIEQDSIDLKQARPTAVNLSWGVDRTKQFLKEALPGQFELRMAGSLAVDFVQRLADDDVNTNKKLSEIGVKLFHSGDSVLTHCN
jgi:methylthioribose-1-phosphate isomerase